jgi:hypothetical protein
MRRRAVLLALGAAAAAPVLAQVRVGEASRLRTRGAQLSHASNRWSARWSVDRARQERSTMRRSSN